MKRSTDLLGRDELIRQVTEGLSAGRSVLLYGPEGIGKSAIVSTVAVDGVVIIDPFQGITRQQACQIRRALDHGAVYLGAARVAERRELGAVGRILWRFSMLRVRELSDGVMRHIVTGELGIADARPAAREREWVAEIVALAQGRPGFATAMARFAVEWRSRHGYLPMPAFACAATREAEAIRTLQRAIDQLPDEVEPPKEHP
jgi:hypothetical protein